MPVKVTDVRGYILDRCVPEPNTGCWLWLGAVESWGYAQARLRGRTQAAHRLSFEEFVGPIPAGMEIDHLCRQRSCVNPSHLEPVTHRENTLRGVSPVAANARRETCRCGRPYDSTRPDRPVRVCSECHAARAREYSEALWSDPERRRAELSRRSERRAADIGKARERERVKRLRLRADPTTRTKLNAYASAWRKARRASDPEWRERDLKRKRAAYWAARNVLTPNEQERIAAVLEGKP